MVVDLWCLCRIHREQSVSYNKSLISQFVLNFLLINIESLRHMDIKVQSNESIALYGSAVYIILSAHTA